MPISKTLHWNVVLVLALICGLLLCLPRDLQILALGKNYLPIHTFMEIIGILLNFSVFIAGWATYKDLKSQKLLILSITSLSVGFLDFAHTLSFSGMPVFFTPSSANKAIYFWFAGRATDCLAFLFLASPWFALTNFKRWRWTSLLITLVWTLLCYVLIIGFEESLPTMFSPTTGLQPLKIVLEWAMILGFFIAGLLFVRQGSNSGLLVRDGASPHLMAMASFLFALGGVFFTQYRNVDDLYNLVGHLYKLAGLGYVYRAVFIECIRMPHSEMKKSAAEAQSANAAKSRFLANVSHEFRTPLGIISGYSDLLSEKPFDAESQQWIATIRRSSLELRYLVDDLLDLTKAETEKITLSMKTFSVANFKDELFAEMSFLAEKKKIKLEIDLPTTFPAFLTTDPNRLRQILVNLIGNSVKFTSAGGVFVQFLNLDDSLIQISVRDTGMGIPEEKKSLLFKPFSQVDDSFTRQFGGTGLGLALSKKLAQLLGGSLWLESSQQDFGSTFVVSFRNLTNSEVNGPGLPEDKLLSNSGTPNLQHLKILVAEDSADLQALISHYLKKTKALVVMTRNGQEAVEKFKTANFDIVVMDIQMPIMDGVQAVQSMRALGWQGPTIALTAHAHESEKDRVLKSGFDYYVTKPFKKEFLIQKIIEATHSQA